MNWISILEAIVGGLLVTSFLAVIGLFVWYIRVKPVIVKLVIDVDKKMDKVDVKDRIEKMVLEMGEKFLFNKKELDGEILKMNQELDCKQDTKVCEPLRDGCSRTILQHFASLEVQVIAVAEMSKEGMKNLREGQEKLWDKIDTWMRRNGKT